MITSSMNVTQVTARNNKFYNNAEAILPSKKASTRNFQIH